MRAPGLILTFMLLVGAPALAQDAEPLPPGAPTEPYPLAAWCYGALAEYLDVYDKVKPDLRAIDKAYGSSVPNENEPYASDMAAARVELKRIGVAVQSAEKASPTDIAPVGIAALDKGRGIWRPAEMHTSRELARAWLSWALPDRCASNAKELAVSSPLLGKALKYNNPSAVDTPAPPASEPAAQSTPAPAASSPPASEPAAESTPAPAASSPPAPEPAAPPSQASTPSGPPPIGGYNSYLDKPAAGDAPSAPTPSDAPASDTPKTPDS